MPNVLLAKYPTRYDPEGIGQFSPAMENEIIRLPTVLRISKNMEPMTVMHVCGHAALDLNSPPVIHNKIYAVIINDWNSDPMSQGKELGDNEMF